MPKNRIRVIVDTNWWVSFVINKFRSQLTDVLLNPRIDIFVSEELTKEIIETLNAQSLQKYINPKIKAEFIQVFPQAVINTFVTSDVSICRDAKDNFLLSLSKDVKADYLVTGDKDLLVLKKFGRTTILKLSDFLLLPNL